jgi:hypothetical protein
MVEMVMVPVSIVIGSGINTHQLTVATPAAFFHDITKSLSTAWDEHRHMYTLPQAVVLAGQLGHIIVSAPWFKYLMTHVYSTLIAALGIA